MEKRVRTWTLLCLLSEILPAITFAQTHEHTLDNGMKIVVREDRRAPVVVSQVWYKVGSSYEAGGITGVSHVLEHLMFKGTKQHPPGEFSRIIAANGGKENAFTARDYTAYYQQLERSRLPIALELEADRMRNLQVDEKEFAKELQVVMEERRLRTDDSPQGTVVEHFFATAFTSSPYQHPIIGWPSDLASLTLSDAMAWYRRWYAPNNATLVVVGDVRADDVFTLARKYFGALPKQDIPPPKPQQELPQKGVRRITVKVPAELPYLVMGYKVPVANTATESWEPYALLVLASVLGGGDSSRLVNELVRGQEIATDVSVGYSPQDRLETLFEFDATPAQGQTVAAIEKVIMQQIKRVQAERVTEAELTRVKAQVVASDVFQRDSMFYQAMQIGMLETNGLGWKVAEKFVENIKAISAQQVQQVAQKYFLDDQLTVAVLEPQPLNGKRVRPAMGDGHVR